MYQTIAILKNSKLKISKFFLGLILFFSFSSVYPLDLRHIHLPPEQTSQNHRVIIQKKFAYQPFIFTDELAVGEGYNFINGRDFYGP